MRGALGNSLLLYIIITFVIIIIVFFTSVLVYSKAYRAKNRIVEIIEKYGCYPDSGNSIACSGVEEEITQSLGAMGYQLGSCKKENLNQTGYKYCAERKTSSEGYYYKVTTYVEFEFPVIGKLFDPPAVTSETKIFVRDYDY